VRGSLREARDRLGKVLARYDGPPEARSTALVAAAWNAYYRGERAACRRLAEEAVALAPLDAPALRAEALNALGVTGMEPDRAEGLLEECLALYREAGETRGELMLLSNLGDLATLRGRYPEARDRLEEGLVLSSSLPSRPFRDALLLNLGQLELVSGNPTAAAERLAEGLAAEGADRSDVVLSGLLLGGAALAKLGRHAEAAQLFGTAERMREELGSEPHELEVRLAGDAMASAERALGSDGYARATTTGRAVPVEEAAAVARAALEPWRPGEQLAG
jgi:tetratricopeptide (TPR) repeat protein